MAGFFIQRSYAVNIGNRPGAPTAAQSALRHPLFDSIVDCSPFASTDNIRLTFILWPYSIVDLIKVN